MFAMPNAPRIKHANLTMSAKAIFSYTMRMHFLEILIACAIFTGLSSIKTTSAASIAASEPRAPIAIPISALASTGASLIPSPTNASISLFPFLPISSSTFVTLSAGRRLPYTSSTPSESATSFPTFSRSPVNITVFLTPAFLSFSMASFESGLTSSDITI